MPIRQRAAGQGKHATRLTLRRPGQPDLEGEATIEFSLTEQEQEDLRWYMEDYLQRAEAVEAVTAEQVEALMRTRGIELYECILEGNRDVQRIFDRVLDDLAGPARRDQHLRRRGRPTASLRDYQHYQGRAADMEAKVQGMIGEIARALG